MKKINNLLHEELGNFIFIECHDFELYWDMHWLSTRVPILSLPHALVYCVISKIVHQIMRYLWWQFSEVPVGIIYVRISHLDLWYVCDGNANVLIHRLINLFCRDLLSISMGKKTWMFFGFWNRIKFITDVIWYSILNITNWFNWPNAWRWLVLIWTAWWVSFACMWTPTLLVHIFLTMKYGMD